MCGLGALMENEVQSHSVSMIVGRITKISKVLVLDVGMSFRLVVICSTVLILN